MTKDELMAMPELQSGFSYEDRIIAGKKVRIPIAPQDGVLWREDADPAWIDCDGLRWEVGILNGRRVRRLLTCNVEAMWCARQIK